MSKSDELLNLVYSDGKSFLNSSLEAKKKKNDSRSFQNVDFCLGASTAGNDDRVSCHIDQWYLSLPTHQPWHEKKLQTLSGNYFERTTLALAAQTFRSHIIDIQTEISIIALRSLISTDVNPLGYWIILENKIDTIKHQRVDPLKQVLREKFISEKPLNLGDYN